MRTNTTTAHQDKGELSEMNIEDLTPGDIRRVTFIDGETLSAVLCPNPRGHRRGGGYWLAHKGSLAAALTGTPGTLYSDFLTEIHPDRVAPSVMTPEKELRYIADLAMVLRAELLESLPERQEEAIEQARQNGYPEFVPAVGPDPVDYGQYVDLLTALAIRLASVTPRESVPLATEES